LPSSSSLLNSYPPAPPTPSQKAPGRPAFLGVSFSNTLGDPMEGDDLKDS